MKSLPRFSVYSIIDQERNYQDQKWNENTTISAGQHGVGDWLVFMQDYMNEAFHVYSRQGEPKASDAALDIIRKVTAMGVACMEQNGAVGRDGVGYGR